jgi:uncharacterized membrane protein
MSTKLSLVFISLLVLVSIVVSIAVYPMLPEQVASHWDSNDQVNGYMSRFWGIALMPIIILGIALLFTIIPSIDPLKANIAQFRNIFNAFIVLILGFMVYIHILTLIYNLGYIFRISLAIIPALGLIFTFAGVLMSKAKRNYFIGIRTPWTLSNDEVWDKTHALGSKMFIVAGIASLLTIFLGENGFWVMMALIMSAAFVPVIYSYVLYRQIVK